MCRKDINAIIYLLLENHTYKVQPIDAGFGKQMKAKIGEAMEKWHWGGREFGHVAWQLKCEAKEDPHDTMDWGGMEKALLLDKMFAKKLFMKTGCLMTADGSDDDMIKPQGLEPYSF